MNTNRLTLFLTAGAAAMLIAGCDRSDDGIRTYDAPKEPPAVVARAKHRPGNTAAAADTKIRWTVPPDWQEVPHGEFSAADYLVSEDPPLKMTVSRFSGMGSAEETLLANLNRWNGQLGRPPLGVEDLRQVLTHAKADGHDVFATDLATPDDVKPATRMLGAIVLDGKSAWAFKIMGPADAVAPHKAEFDQVVKSINFGGGAAPDETAADAPADKPAAPPPVAAQDVAPIAGIASMSLPEGWQLLPPKDDRGFGGRSITFTEGDARGQVIITELNAASLTNMLLNLNRWRDQVMLPATQNEADNPAEPFEMAQGPAQMREFSGPEGAPGPRLRQWVVYTRFPNSSKVWFFKLLGPYDLATKTKPAFDKFVKSVKLEDVK